MSESTIQYSEVAISNSQDKVASLTINRPKFANAFNGELMEEISATLNKLKTRPQVRALIIKAEGKHFSAGADLNWMHAAKDLSHGENKEESKKLSKMFDAISSAPIPTICLVNGATYGGAVGIVAACDITIGYESARFCLSEVKIGLLPAVILPFLKRRMHASQLNRYGVTAALFSAEDALKAGLLDFAAPKEEALEILKEQLNLILGASPSAQAAFKNLNRELELSPGTSRELAVKAIADARASEQGQAGLAAFFEKQPAAWVCDVDLNWVQDLVNS